MMRWILALMTTALTISIANASAQNPTLIGVKNENSTTTTPVKPTPPASQVMPSNEFSAAATQEHTQIKSGLKQQMQEEINANKPNYRADTSAPPVTTPSTQNNDAPPQTTEETSTTTTPTTSSAKLPPTKTQIPATPAPTTPSNNYTGFGTGTSTGTSGSGSQGSSSSWGIKY